MILKDYEISTIRDKRANRLACMLYFLTGITNAGLMCYVPLELYRRSGNVALLSFTFMIVGIARFGGLNFWGPVFDRFRNVKYFMILSSISFTAIPMSMIYFSSTKELMISILIFTFISSCGVPAIQAWLTAISKNTSGSALGKLFSFDTLGWFIACITAALLFSYESINSFNWLMLFSAFTGVMVSITCILFFPAFTLGRDALEDIPLSPIESIKLTWSNPALLRSACMILTACTGNLIMFSMFSAYYCDYLGGSSSMLGIMLAAATINGTLIFPWLGKLVDRIGPLSLMRWTLISYVGCFVLMSTIKNPLIAGIVYSLPIFSGLRVAANALGVINTELKNRGGGLGLIESLEPLATISGSAAGGYIASNAGLGFLPLMAAFIITIALLLLTLWRPTLIFTNHKPLEVSA